MTTDYILPIIIYEMWKVNQKFPVGYREIVGIMLGLQVKGQYLVPSQKIMVSEAGPWSAMIGQDVSFLKDQGFVEISRSSYDSALAPLKPMKEYLRERVDRTHLKSLRGLLKQITPADLEEHIPWRWAKHRVYEEEGIIRADPRLDRFDRLWTVPD
ncbi:MAG: hypothetical protein KKF68_01770 [Nanoarchaeota archaeon]|nr:hypothetical protein [Nanoarchaeota archaeon]